LRGENVLFSFEDLALDSKGGFAAQLMEKLIYVRFRS